MTGLLASPIAWSHHWVWCLPVTVLLWCHARRWFIPTLVVFWSYEVWMLPHGDSVELHMTRPQIAMSGLYVAYGLVFLAVLGRRIVRPDAATADEMPTRRLADVAS